jgi:hypothetical protein
VSRPIDQIDSSHTKPSELEHDGQPSSGLALPGTLTVSQRGPVTLLRLSRPAKRNALDESTIAGLETSLAIRPRRRASLSCLARESIFPLAPISIPLPIQVIGTEYLFPRLGTALSTESRMAACLLSRYCTAR